MACVNSWNLFAHPLFLDQLERLEASVARDRDKNPAGFRGSANYKVLAALRKLVFETVPADPLRPEYRQGSTLGTARRHWFRAKFGGQRFRLFFRFDVRAKIIIYVWVNDAGTLRTYGSKTDAYAVFKRMLDNGNPPEAWSDLLSVASADDAVARLEKSEKD